jgi:hypothetical protein
VARIFLYRYLFFVRVLSELFQHALARLHGCISARAVLLGENFLFQARQVRHRGRAFFDVCDHLAFNAETAFWGRPAPVGGHVIDPAGFFRRWRIGGLLTWFFLALGPIGRPTDRFRCDGQRRWPGFGDLGRQPRRRLRIDGFDKLDRQLPAERLRPSRKIRQRHPDNRGFITNRSNYPDSRQVAPGDKQAIAVFPIFLTIVEGARVRFSERAMASRSSTS